MYTNTYYTPKSSYASSTSAATTVQDEESELAAQHALRDSMLSQAVVLDDEGLSLSQAEVVEDDAEGDHANMGARGNSSNTFDLDAFLELPGATAPRGGGEVDIDADVEPEGLDHEGRGGGSESPSQAFDMAAWERHQRESVEMDERTVASTGTGTGTSNSNSNSTSNSNRTSTNTSNRNSNSGKADEFDQLSPASKVRRGTVVVLCGAVWCCVVLCGAVWCCVVLCGAV